MKSIVLTALTDEAETREIRYILHEDVEAYKTLGWTAYHDALKGTNHGRYSVLMWREIG